MGRNSKIEWTQDTWNPITGCSVVSPGCTNCYAMGLAGTRLRNHPSRAGLTDESKAGPVWNGKVRLNEDWLTQPLKWRRPRTIFVCAHGDLFHENVPDEWIDRVFAVMALSPQHTFQVLTKRAKRMREYVEALGKNAARDKANDLPAHWQVRLANANAPGSLSITKADAERCLGLAPLFTYDPPVPSWPLPNVWLGVSAEDQTRADERVPDLLATPAAVRFVSAEPLLGPISPPGLLYYGTHRSGGIVPLRTRGKAMLDWIIVGGESGPNARPMQVPWARSIVQQCKASGVACFVKQLGADPIWEDGAFLNLAHRKGADMAEWPDDLRVREVPDATA